MIHPSAVIDTRAELASDVSVGPYAVIEGEVSIGEGTTIGAHAVLKGPTRIGRDNRIFQFCSLGEEPQDKKYAGEPTRLEVGDGNVFREYCTVNRGTVQDTGVTRIGDHNWIMAYVHVAHDCRVGDHVIFANGTSLAGHALIEDHVILGGFSLVHQFCRIGTHAFSAMGSAIPKDVPPFVMVSGNFAEPHGLNIEGLRRHGFGKENVATLRRAYKILYRQGLSLEQAKTELKVLAETTPEVGTLLTFLEGSQRGILR